MANNPYGPPTAEVTDRPDEPARGRPRAVLIGTGIIAVLCAYSLFGLANYNFAGRLEALRGHTTFELVFVFLPATLLLVEALAVVFAFLRQRWARTTLVILFVWTFLSVIAGIYTFIRLRQETFAGLVEVFLFSWTLFVIRTIALGLLFTPSANAWFRARYAVKRPA